MAGFNFQLGIGRLIKNIIFNIMETLCGRVVKLAYTLALGASAARLEGSSPSSPIVYQ